MDFTDMLQTLYRMGFMDVVLPFMLAFTVVYAVLYTFSLGSLKGDTQKAKKFALIVALVMGFGFVVPHVTGAYRAIGFDPVEVVMTALPQVALVAVAIVAIFIILGLFGIELNISKGFLLPVFVFVLAGIVIYIFGSAAGWGWGVPSWLSWLQDDETIALLVSLLVFGLMVMFITREPKKPEEKKEGGFENFMKTLGKGLGKD